MYIQRKCCSHKNSNRNFKIALALTFQESFETIKETNESTVGLWGQGEPNEAGPEDCLEIWGFDLVWNDNRCHLNWMGFVVVESSVESARSDFEFQTTVLAVG